MPIIQDRNTSLPIHRGIARIFAFSLIITVIMTAASIAGVIYGKTIYPTKELYETFVPNDIVNLLIGLPILLGSMCLARRGKLIGLLCWPGALLFVLYNYLIYIFAVPISWIFLVHIILFALSVYTFVDLLASIDGKAVQQHLIGAVHERFSGGVLAGFGILFFLRAISIMVNALTHKTLIAPTDLAAAISDFLITPLWIIGGVLLWRQRVLGYVTSLGLLFQASMLFIALILVLLFQPLVVSVPFAATDVVVIFVMGLICFIPFALFLWGALSKQAKL